MSGREMSALDCQGTSGHRQHSALDGCEEDEEEGRWDVGRRALWRGESKVIPLGCHF